MNKKGFISMTLVYTFLILFLFLMLGVLHAYASKNKFLEAINEHIDLSVSTPVTYGMTISQALLSSYYPEESGIIDYSKNSEGRYETRTGITQNITSVTNGLYLTQVVDDEDNNKIHMTENDKTVYFFRGSVDNNYVALGNTCWKIYRTNEDESTRLIYFGNYDASNNMCTINTDNLPLTTYNENVNDNMYEEELKICKEIINKVKWYTERKDYNGLKLYIDEKEKFIDNYIINSNNAEEDYIDKLVNDLK